MSEQRTIEGRRPYGHPEGVHFDRDAEEVVLGSMMESPKAVANCIAILGRDSNVFYLTPHKIIYELIIELSDDGKAVDPILVGERIDGDGGLNRIGGGKVLYDYVEKVPTTENADYYAEVVKEKHLRRELDIGARQILTITQEEKPIDETMALAQEAILKVGSERISQHLTPSEQVNSTYEYFLRFADMDSTIEISTGFADLDMIIGGLHRQEFFILAGPTSVGKSAVLHNMLYHIAVKNELPCLLFCYESNHHMVHARMVASQTSINLSETPKELPSTPVVEVLSQIKQSSLIIRDNCPMSIEYAVAETRRVKLEHPELAVVAFDHLHQMTSEGDSSGNRNQELTNISGQLKQLSKTTDVAVVALAQMSRSITRRKDPRPELSDLRDCGALEYDGDTIVFVHREDYFDKVLEAESPTELIIKKQRDGQLGICEYSYYRKMSQFKGF